MKLIILKFWLLGCICSLSCCQTGDQADKGEEPNDASETQQKTNDANNNTTKNEQSLPGANDSPQNGAIQNSDGEVAGSYDQNTDNQKIENKQKQNNREDEHAVEKKVVVTKDDTKLVQKKKEEIENTELDKKKEEEIQEEPPLTNSWIVPIAARSKKNPTTNDEESIDEGKLLYAKFCKSCHGKTGEGDGPKAEDLDTSCVDFTTSQFQSQSDGELFYKTDEGRDEMPAFKKKIPEDEEIWNIVNYLRTLQ